MDFINSAAKAASAYSASAAKAATAYSAKAVSAVEAAVADIGDVTVNGRTVTVIKLLAEGGFGFVYLARDSMTGEEFVLKRMAAQTDEALAMQEREAALMEQLQHPNIVKVYGSLKRRTERRSTEYWVLMEYCTGGTAFKLVTEAHGPVPEAKIWEIFLAVCKAVAHMHAQEPPVTHRDIKLENVLLTARGECRLIDFGSCSTRRSPIRGREDRLREQDIIEHFTTPSYRSPEMCDLYARMPIDERADIWALGCMLYAMAFKKHPFEEGTNLAIINGRYSIPEYHGYSPAVPALIRACLGPTPAERPTAAALVACVSALVAGGPFVAPAPSGVLGYEGETAGTAAAPAASAGASPAAVATGSLIDMGESGGGGGKGADGRPRAPSGEAEGAAVAAAAGPSEALKRRQLHKKHAAPAATPTALHAPAAAAAAAPSWSPFSGAAGGGGGGDAGGLADVFGDVALGGGGAPGAPPLVDDNWGVPAAGAGAGDWGAPPAAMDFAPPPVPPTPTRAPSDGAVAAAGVKLSAAPAAAASLDDLFASTAAVPVSGGAAGLGAPDPFAVPVTAARAARGGDPFASLVQVRGCASPVQDECVRAPRPYPPSPHTRVTHTHTHTPYPPPARPGTTVVVSSQRAALCGAVPGGGRPPLSGRCRSAAHDGRRRRADGNGRHGVRRAAAAAGHGHARHGDARHGDARRAHGHAHAVAGRARGAHGGAGGPRSAGGGRAGPHRGGGWQEGRVLGPPQVLVSSVCPVHRPAGGGGGGGESFCFPALGRRCASARAPGARRGARENTHAPHEGMRGPNNLTPRRCSRPLIGTFRVLHARKGMQRVQNKCILEWWIT